jgi:hypothetical protein
MSKSLDYQVATRAREIIADPECWLRGELAATADRRSVDPTDDEAYRFCAVGALRRAVHEIAPGRRMLADRIQLALEDYVLTHHPDLHESLESLNDEGDHALVMRIFDEFLAERIR